MKQLTLFEEYFGKKINRIGFGGIPIQGLTEIESDKVIQHALDSGINFIDTARGYSDSEEKIGKVLHKRRSDVFFATKSMARDFLKMKEEITASLHACKIDYIDLYQCHGVGSTEDLKCILDRETGAIGALLEAQKQSKIKFIGITGHASTILVEAVKTGMFDSVQIPHNIIETECEKELLGICKEKNIPVIAMKPIGGGAFKDVASLNLRYILNNGSTIAIPGMDSQKQIDNNMSVLPEIYPLSDDEFKTLTTEKEFWKGEFCRRCGYCLPCSNNLKIPMLLLLQAYWERYELKQWVFDRFAPLEKKYSDCIACGDCISKCPYSLPIIDMMEKGKNTIERSFKTES